METDSQKIVKYFFEKNDLKLNGAIFKKQLGIANNLLKNYELQEIIIMIDYLYLFPTKSKIISLGYFPYIIDETIPKAKAYFYKEQTKNTISEIKEEVEVKNEVIGKKSMFSRNRRF